MTTVINCPGCNRRIRVSHAPRNRTLGGEVMPEWATPGFICARCGGRASVARSIELTPGLRQALEEDELLTLQTLNIVLKVPSGDTRSAGGAVLYSVKCLGPISTKRGLAQTLQEAVLLGAQFAAEAYDDSNAPKGGYWTSTVTHPNGKRWRIHDDGTTYDDNDA